MPHLAFDVRDYSTKLPLALVGELLVLVPRRDSGLPPLSERPDSSVRLAERRLYFDTVRSDSGVVVAPDVPPATYAVHLRARSFVPLDESVASPMTSPLRVDLHRDFSYPFAAGDTVIRGSVVRASGAALTGYDVQLIDPDAAVPQHRVPLNPLGQFLIFVPEKSASSTVTLDVFHPGGMLPIVTPPVIIHRSNTIPLITVP